MVDGIEQEPMDGISFLYTFDDAAAPERQTVQYFEMAGSRAIYKDGWWACARLDKLPWDISRETLMRFAPGSGWDPDADRWELYDLTTDFSQAHDLAGERPELLAELKELFWQEAARNNVLPLLGGYSALFGDLPPLPTVTRFTFAGDVQNVLQGMVPRIIGRSYAIEAELEVPEGGAEGVIVANADHMGGFALWVDGDGLLRHTYSFAGVETYRQKSGVRAAHRPGRRSSCWSRPTSPSRARRPASRCSSATRRWATDGSSTPSRSCGASTPAWTWAVTTAAWSIGSTRTRPPTPSAGR